MSFIICPEVHILTPFVFQNQEVHFEINMIIILVTKVSKWRLILPITENCEVQRVSRLGGTDDEFGFGWTTYEWSRKLETWGRMWERSEG